MVVSVLIVGRFVGLLFVYVWNEPETVVYVLSSAENEAVCQVVRDLSW